MDFRCMLKKRRYIKKKKGCREEITMIETVSECEKTVEMPITRKDFPETWFFDDIEELDIET